MHLDDPVSLYLPDFANVRVYNPTANGGKGGKKSIHHACMHVLNVYVYVYVCVSVVVVCVRA